MVKLLDKKIRWIVRHVGKDMTTKQSAEAYNISIKRVQQLIQEYKETGRVPHLLKRRRPRTYLTEEQKEIIERV